MVGVLIGQGLAQSPSVVPFPRDYNGSLVKYAVVDRSDGLSLLLLVADEADPLAREGADARRMGLLHLDGTGWIVELEADHCEALLDTSWSRAEYSPGGRHPSQ